MKPNFIPASVIRKKRDGETLTDTEITQFIGGIVDGTIPEYQASAFLMATFFNGMTPGETASLTHAMLHSGEVYEFTKTGKPVVDKHSTGGIGDKVSLILAPLCATLDLAVPMMAGRGLGHTGGTIDKLEAIPGYRTKLSRAEFEKCIETVGCAIIGQSESIAPADRKLYALRDVTATVECVPLICGSILSKKLAEGTQSLLLDVKVGSGAFMQSKDKARTLAKALIQVAKKMHLNCRAFITNMDQPLGNAVGNTVEVIESIELLKTGKGPSDLKEVTIALCAQMLEMTGKVKTAAQGRKLALEKLSSGAAYKKFLEMVEFQGGDIRAIEDPSRLPLSPLTCEVPAATSGYLTQFKSREIGLLLIELGGGRKRAEDAIDPSVGFVFHKKLGARVSKGESLATIYYPKHLNAEELQVKLRDLMKIQASRKAAPKLLGEILD